MQEPYVYIWAFEVDADADAQFRHHYGPDGAWVQLFRRHEGFVETLLLSDRARPGRYLTVDRWRSLQQYRDFRARFADEYAALDRQCAALTRYEVELGTFAEVRPD